MKHAATDDNVIAVLEAALAAGSIPSAARDYAEHLLRRLVSPVRVSVLGLPKSGKSELINMFIGRRVLPEDVTLPTTEIVYGEKERATVTRADGSVVTEDKIELAKIAGTKAAFLKLEIPAPILQRTSLLEVVTDGTAADLSSAVDWSVRRTDIALWCSQAFDDLEQSVWRRVPDSLKDHAFLVLTKADLLSAEKILSKRVASLETIVAEEFHSLFAVATLQALNAHGAGGSIDDAMYHGSGGGALSAEILRHAERGRRADFDGAHMFLARYKISPDILQDKASAKPKAQPERETPRETAPAETLRIRPRNVTLLSDAVRFLKRRGDSLGEAAAALGEGQAKPLVDQCVDAVEYLVDLFSQDDSGCPVADAFMDELAEAADMMVLMQVEEGDTPAADAATLLLQLRRDMEMTLAA